MRALSFTPIAAASDVFTIVVVLWVWFFASIIAKF
jgi:hypothetical protein